MKDMILSVACIFAWIYSAAKPKQRRHIAVKAPTLLEMQRMDYARIHAVLHDREWDIQLHSMLQDLDIDPPTECA